MEILMWLRDIIALNLPFFSIIGSSAIISASYLPGILKIKKRQKE